MCSRVHGSSRSPWRIYSPTSAIQCCAPWSHSIWTFFTFSGYLLAPIIFALALPYVGNYGACFVVLAAIALLAVPALWRFAQRPIG